jgi:hypothetical protein
MNTDITEQKIAAPSTDLAPEPPLENMELLVEFFELLIKVDRRVNGNKYINGYKDEETKTLATQTPDVTEVV